MSKPKPYYLVKTILNMGKTTIDAFLCDRCGHTWLPRLKIDEDPTICPKCKSAYWNKPRRIDLAKDTTTLKDKKKYR